MRTQYELSGRDGLRAVHRSSGPFVLGAVLSVGLALGTVRPVSAEADSPPVDAVTALAKKYTPIMYIAPIDQFCRVTEDYLPAPVDIVLSNPAIQLRESGRQAPVVRGPIAADLAGRGGNFYLKYPGDPAGNRCVYAADGDRLMRGRQSVVYGTVTLEMGKPGLALQYWFYYYFDTWVNVHEGDWEMIQLRFAASSAQQALKEKPVEVAYAQHGGGERAGWDDQKVGSR
jgi:hypothetical protein